MSGWEDGSYIQMLITPNHNNDALSLHITIREVRFPDKLPNISQWFLELIDECNPYISYKPLMPPIEELWIFLVEPCIMLFVSWKKSTLELMANSCNLILYVNIGRYIYMGEMALGELEATHYSWWNIMIIVVRNCWETSLYLLTIHVPCG